VLKVMIKKKKDNAINLSVIIPCYNGGSEIRDSVLSIDTFLKEFSCVGDYEIICIDDGSKDETRKVISSLVRKNRKIRTNAPRTNRGKGYSVKEGIFLSRFDFILFTDADLSTPISEIKKFIPYIDDYDVLIASRNMRDSEVERSFFRSLISRIFVFLNRILCGLKYRDTQCGFKIFRRETAKEIFKMQKLEGFSFDVEVLFLAERLNYRVKEIPVRWADSGSSSVRIFRDSFKMFCDLLKIKSMHNVEKFS
jgi:dolichyl-phosphate beta-glucosyltransferase